MNIMYDKMMQFIESAPADQLDLRLDSNFLQLNLEDMDDQEINWVGLNFRILRDVLSSDQVTDIILKIIRKLDPTRVNLFYHYLEISKLDLTENQNAIIIIEKNSRHFGGIDAYMTDFLKKDQDGSDIVSKHITNYMPLYGLLFILRNIFESKMDQLSDVNKRKVLNAFDRIRMHLNSVPACAVKARRSRKHKH